MTLVIIGFRDNKIIMHNLQPDMFAYPFTNPCDSTHEDNQAKKTQTL